MFFSFHSAKATETPKLKFDHLSVADGLSSGSVFSMVQDKEGFIWFATFEGLNRFDGVNFIQYRHRENEPNSIADNLIRKVFVDKIGNLWVGTHNGLSRYNKSLDNFDNFYNQPDQANSLYDNLILDIFSNNDDELYISTDKGVQRFNQDSNDFTRIKFVRTDQKVKSIRTLVQDKKDNYWLGSIGNGIFLTTSKFKKLTNLKQPKTDSNWQLKINADILYDFRIVNNDYWLATDNGLFIVSNNYILKHHFTIETSKGLLLSNEIRSIQVIDGNKVWLATRKGLNELNTDTNDLRKLVSQDKDTADFRELWLMSLLKDTNGQVWVGTYGQGIYKYNPAKSIFKLSSNSSENKRVMSLAELEIEDKIWFNNDSGQLFSSLNLSSQQAFHLSKIDIAKLSTFKNQLIFNTYDNSLFMYSPSAKKLIEIENWRSKSDYDVHYQLYDIEDSICYLSNSKSIRCYQPATQSYLDVQIPTNKEVILLGSSDSNELIAISNNNEILISNKNSTNFLKSYKVQDANQNIKHITASDNWIWLSTKKNTIHLINRDTGKETILSSSNGLKGIEVTSIVVDNEENLWFSTSGGISLIDPNTLNIKHFESEYGLANSEFINSSLLKLKNGDILFGGLLGYVHFSPKMAIVSTAKLLPLTLTQIQIKNDKLSTQKNYGESIFNEKKSQFMLNSSLLEATKLAINYDQFPLNIEFISPNSNLSSHISYSYRLDGSGEEWLNTNSNSNNASAIFTNLSPGEYIFEAKAVDIFNPKNSTTKQLNISVIPPWWLSSGALFIYGLIFFLFCLYVFQQMRHKRQYHLQIKASEERLKLSLWGSGDEMWDWNVTTGKIFRSNIWGTLDFPQDGKRNVGTEHTNIHPYDIPRVKATLNAHFEKRTEHFEATYRVKSQTDKWMWVLDRGKIVERDDKGEPTRMTGTLKDISQIKKAEERLKLFAKCIENISDAVIIYDRQFTVVDVNKAYESITARSKEQILGTPFQFALYPESFTQGIKKHLITNGSWRGEIENKRPNGELYFTDLSLDVIRDESDNISHFVAVFSDVTSRKETEAELRKLANSDTLTGLPNRSFFQANQQQLVNNKTPHALLVFDLDNFKKINDSMGHQVGDMLLIAVAKRLVKLSNNKNIVYRLGGDEFSIILENTNDIHTITSVAKHILSAIAQPLKIKNQEIVLYSSIGIVLYPEDGATPQELLKNADTAMYHAKGSGGNKYQFFSDSMNKQAVKRLQVESLIRHGLKDDLFSVFYQPKIEISTGKIAGMEALVRFETPTKGIISPLVFIPVSEETGQIIDIGEIVLRKSCFATKKWVDAGMFDGRIAVNLSAVQFTQPNLVTVISDILEESGLPPKYLELEITEGTVMDSPQKAIDTMLQIRAMGIHLSLDDFGTGYSSLAYLKKFPLNTLKIDKAFVDDIEVSEQGRNMVATIVTIAHNLGLHVVAEGVENNNQLNFLAGLECEQLQGYLYSKPLPESEFQKYLLSHQITDQSTLSITGKR